jgi:dipeptidyl aminopeptidase/acylaminoacyl peptidase
MRTIDIERFVRSILLCLCIPALSAGADSRDPMAVAFGTMPAFWNVQISPDGGKIVFLKMHSDDIAIAVVFDLAGGKARVALASEKDRFELSWCEWANEERLLCGYYAIHRDAHDLIPVTRLVAIDADGSNVKVLMQNRLKQSFTQYQDQIVDWLPEDREHVLIEKPDRRGSGVSKLNIYSGSLKTAEGVRSSVYGWMTDGRGDPRLRFLIGERDYRWQYRLKNEKKWRPLHEWKHADIEEDYQPIGFGDDPNLLLVLKRHEGRIALWSEDLAGDREAKVVFAHSEVDVGGSLRLGKFRRVVAIGYSTDRNHLHFFDTDIEKITDKIGVSFPDQEVTIADESWDRRFYLVHIGSDTNPGSLYRFDARANELALISRQYPKLEGVALSVMKPMRYAARDGTAIPGYLTMPASAPEGPMPTVVLPHGGPQSRDYWSYDWLTQFMSARGYAVLQSNYRGSGGYGADWSGEGGFRNWRRAIDDVTDGARHLIEAGIADPDRLCIVGWSYGGYAALMSAVEEPELYRCVVSIAGVTDLPELIHDSRGFLGWRGTREFVGTDSDVLETGSPAMRAAEFRAPVLLLHGDEDINVQFEHSKKMAKALKKEKKDVELIRYEEVAHSIRRNQYRIDMLERIGAFLDENTHSGSRAQ